MARLAYIIDGQERPYKTVETFRWDLSTLRLKSWRVVANNAGKFKEYLKWVA